MTGFADDTTCNSYPLGFHKVVCECLTVQKSLGVEGNLVVHNANLRNATIHRLDGGSVEADFCSVINGRAWNNLYVGNVLKATILTSKFVSAADASIGNILGDASVRGNLTVSGAIKSNMTFDSLRVGSLIDLDGPNGGVYCADARVDNRIEVGETIQMDGESGTVRAPKIACASEAFPVDPPVTNATQRIEGIRGHVTGLAVDQVALFFPEAIHRPRPQDPPAIDLGVFNALLVEAIRELADRCTAIESKI